MNFAALALTLQLLALIFPQQLTTFASIPNFDVLFIPPVGVLFITYSLTSKLTLIVLGISTSLVIIASHNPVRALHKTKIVILGLSLAGSGFWALSFWHLYSLVETTMIRLPLSSLLVPSFWKLFPIPFLVYIFISAIRKKEKESTPQSKIGLIIGIVWILLVLGIPIYLISRSLILKNEIQISLSKHPEVSRLINGVSLPDGLYQISPVKSFIDPQTNLETASLVLSAIPGRVYQTTPGTITLSTRLAKISDENEPNAIQKTIFLPVARNQKALLTTVNTNFKTYEIQFITPTGYFVTITSSRIHSESLVSFAQTLR